MILSQALLDFSREHEHKDIYTFALQAKQYPQIDFKKALQQIKGLQIAKHKLPSWYGNEAIIYPVHLSLEQCSSEETASYKSEIVPKGECFVDLTGGLGVDTASISKKHTNTVYIEQQGELSEIAKYNFGVLGLKSIQVFNNDSVEYLQQMPKVDLIYIDPARRDVKGRKTVLIEDCTPNLLEIQELLASKANIVMIKLSPMLDISLALQSLKAVCCVHIISVDNECKELLFIQNASKKITCPILKCINIMSDTIAEFSFTKEEEDNATSTYTSSVAKYLYEPNASIMKAGGYKSVGYKFELKKLHTNSHLYTSDELVDKFPGRVFEVITTSTLSKKGLKESLQNISQANISVRNFPMKPEELRSKLKLKDGGDIYIFATTLANNQRTLIICKKTNWINLL